MRCFLACLVGVAFLATSFCFADDGQSKSINKDRKILEGRWRATSMEVQGNKSSKSDTRKISVVNHADGRWEVLSEGKAVSSGTSEIDPYANPKTIDFSVTEGGGEGKSFLGIYVLNKNRRKLCFAPAERGRPQDFATIAGSEQVLVEFRRVGQESPLTLQSLPVKVKAALLDALVQNLEQLSVEEIELEEEDGESIYEAEIVFDGKRFEVEVTPSGDVAEWEADDDDDDDQDGDD